VLPHWAEPEGVNKTWTKEYVTNYPKAFHYFAAALPFETNVSVGVAVAILMVLLLLGIFMITYTIKPNFWGAFLSIMGFLIISETVAWRYFYYYTYVTYAQLMFNVILIWGFWLFVFIILKYQKRIGLLKKIMMVSLIGVIVFCLLLLTHNIRYDLGLLASNLPRLAPLIISVVIPFLCASIRRDIAMFVSLMLCLGLTLRIHGMIFDNLYFFNLQQPAEWIKQVSLGLDKWKGAD
jgi:hypothetical protein